MDFMLAVLVGLLFAAGLYLMLRRSIVKLVIGLILLGNAANLLIFSAAGVTRDVPPLLGENGAIPVAMADPLPQALILTAIVIAFGVFAFAVVLIHRAHEIVGTDDLDLMKDTDS